MNSCACTLIGCVRLDLGRYRTATPQGGEPDTTLVPPQQVTRRLVRDKDVQRAAGQWSSQARMDTSLPEASISVSISLRRTAAATASVGVAELWDAGDDDVAPVAFFDDHTVCGLLTERRLPERHYDPDVFSRCGLVQEFELRDDGVGEGA